MSYKPATSTWAPRACALLACAVLSCCFLSAATAWASPGVAGSLAAAAAAELAKKVTAPSAILMEATTGRVLWEKNADVARPIASVVKIMTTLVMEALEAHRISLNDMAIASEHGIDGRFADLAGPGESMAVSTSPGGCHRIS